MKAAELALGTIKREPGEETRVQLEHAPIAVKMEDSEAPTLRQNTPEFRLNTSTRWETDEVGGGRLAEGRWR